MTSLIPIILAGGKGERFWPLSRKQRPKQFLSLDGSGESLLQSTASRLIDIAENWNQLFVITSALIADGVRQQLPHLPESNLLVEPEGKDTAPAVAWGTLEVAKRYGNDAVVGFFPADHWIGDTRAYGQTLQAAAELAAKERAIVTLGIKPNSPSTGYGYIEQGKLVSDDQLPVYKVNRFTEKPNLATAQSFLEAGSYSWNSGMFIFRAGVVLDELSVHAPKIIDLLKAKGKQAYAELDKISIDYALMEKTELAYVLPANFGWDDLGDWNAIERLLKQEGQVNVELGNHIARDTQNAIIYTSDDEEVVVTIGLEDVVIVRDRNVTLVVNKNRTQEIKQVVKSLADTRFEGLL